MIVLGNKDITYCIYAGCEHKDCYRHPDLLRALKEEGVKYVSIADFRGVCRKYISTLLDELEKGDKDA